MKEHAHTKKKFVVSSLISFNHNWHVGGFPWTLFYLKSDHVGNNVILWNAQVKIHLVFFLSKILLCIHSSPLKANCRYHLAQGHHISSIHRQKLLNQIWWIYNYFHISAPVGMPVHSLQSYKRRQKADSIYITPTLATQEKQTTQGMFSCHKVIFHDGKNALRIWNIQIHVHAYMLVRIFSKWW